MLHRVCAKSSNNALCAPRDKGIRRGRTQSDSTSPPESSPPQRIIRHCMNSHPAIDSPLHPVPCHCAWYPGPPITRPLLHPDHLSTSRSPGPAYHPAPFYVQITRPRIPRATRHGLHHLDSASPDSRHASATARRATLHPACRYPPASLLFCVKGCPRSRDTSGAHGARPGLLVYPASTATLAPRPPLLESRRPACGCGAGIRKGRDGFPA